MKPERKPLRFTEQAVGQQAAIMAGGQQAQAPSGLPFSVEFQGMLLKLLLTDREFGAALADHVAPEYFANPAHQWAWQQAKLYRAQFWGFPTLGFLESLAGQQSSGLVAAALATVRNAQVTDEPALRQMTLEFVRRQAFRKAYLDSRDLYNAGKFDAAYDLMKDRLASLESVSWAPVRRSWLAEGLVDRVIARQDPANANHRGISTGLPDVDGVLDGGLHLGELGLWLAYPKAGKTTFLVNLGHNAVKICWRPVLHCVLEGNLQYIEARYDTLLMDEVYTNTKRGDVDATKYAKAVQEAQYLRRMCVIRDFTADAWETSILPIDAEMKDLQHQYGFRPDLVVLDYVDLLRARTPQDSETKHQTMAMKDLKALANRGYAVWTASQVQRPKNDDFKDAQDVLTSAKVADSYAKIRIADFIGSINQTEQERVQNVMRLYLEMYRDGAAGKLVQIHADFSRMQFAGGGGVPMPGKQPAGKPLGYSYAAMVQAKHGQ